MQLWHRHGRHRRSLLSFGGALAQVISSKIPDVSATAQSGNASVANVNLVAQDEVETAFIQNNVLDSAYSEKISGRGNP